MFLQNFMRYLIICLSAIFLFTACQKAETQQSNTSANAKRYDLKGKVVSVDKAAKKAKIEHEAIPDFMEAMTMDFPIKEDWVWEDLTPGAEIRAELVVDNAAKEPFWLEKIGIVANANPNQPVPPIDERFAQIGKDVVNFTLTNQDGKKISPADFKGKAWAITFIYARCPLADYCIKMSTNFSDLANQLNANPEFKDKMSLLSISFDPANDTPEKLRQYGQGYMGKDAKPDFSVWQLAVGTDKQVRPIADFFGLRYEIDEKDKTQFNHSLRTAVISPEGKVTKILSGNSWTPDDLFREMKASLK